MTTSATTPRRAGHRGLEHDQRHHRDHDELGDHQVRHRTTAAIGDLGGLKLGHRRRPSASPARPRASRITELIDTVSNPRTQLPAPRVRPRSSPIGVCCTVARRSSALNNASRIFAVTNYGFRPIDL
jgi:hypothetical protein